MTPPSLSRTLSSPLFRSIPLSTRRAASTSSSSRPKSTPTTAYWPSKTHLRPAPSIPAPLPAIYPQKVVLTDGSTFTSYTTAPTPAINRLTRDVTNNPLWAPGTEKMGIGEGSDEGRVGKFRRRFEEEVASVVGAEDGREARAKASAFAESDLAWMSEGAKEDTVSEKQKGGPAKSKPAGKKK